MEPIISKLQEGVKYPRFERDATKTINDLVDHITKERGIYSSSIEPNPSEHSVWFNINDNTLYIYNKGIWKAINDNDTDILNEPIVFYCSKGTLYYDANTQENGYSGIDDISGFYIKDRLRYIIEKNENNSIEQMHLNYVYIEPENNSTIIIGSQPPFTGILSILGEDLDYAKIYMYNNKLHIGNKYDDNISMGGINWYETTIYCNCKQIGDITITNKDSGFSLIIDSIKFVVGNNNKLIIDNTLNYKIRNSYFYVINQVDGDKSSIVLPQSVYTIKEYVNLCGTRLDALSTDSISCDVFITTTIDDIDLSSSSDSPIYISSTYTLIVDAVYRKFKYTGFIESMSTCPDLKVYVTDAKLFDFLKSKRLKPIMAVSNNSYYDDKVIVNYKTTDGTDIYNTTIYKR